MSSGLISSPLHSHAGPALPGRWATGGELGSERHVSVFMFHFVSKGGREAGILVKKESGREKEFGNFQERMELD